MSGRLPPQPEGCSCSSWWAYGSGLNNPLHTSTFFLLLRVSLSFSCCGVLSCVGQRRFDSGGGGFPQGYRRFFHSHHWRIAPVVTGELFGHTRTTYLACTKASFAYFGEKSGASSKRLFSIQQTRGVYFGRGLAGSRTELLKATPFFLLLICFFANANQDNVQMLKTWQVSLLRC